MPDMKPIADRLIAHIRDYEQCFVAFSGGVDSALVAKAAYVALGANATAVTAVSPSLAGGELAEAKKIAELIGIEHRVINTQEFSNRSYVRNEADRCYHCKTELYDQLGAICRQFPGTVIANGTNTDDAQDYRPGLKAAFEHQIRSPLAECRLDKSNVRALAAFFDLPVWNKPAMPCLSSRVAYGEEVTPERLRMIDRAEQFLKEHGFSLVRVRYHRGDLARLEVPVEELSRLVSQPMRSELITHLEEIGFCFVTIDLQGFRSGSLNSLVPIEVLRSNAARDQST